MARKRVARDVSRSETSKYLENALRNDRLQQKLIAIVGKRYQCSANAGEIEDFVQDFLVAMLERDTVAKRREKGEPDPTLGKMGWWASNQAQKSIRTEARNPVTRAIMGAKTQIDRMKEAQGIVDVRTFTADPGRIAVETSANDDTEVIMNVVVEPDMQALSESDLMHEVRLILWDRLGIQQGTLHFMIVNLLCEGCTKKDIYEGMGVTPIRLNEMITTIQQSIGHLVPLPR